MMFDGVRESVCKRFPVGCRVCLLHMDDPYPVPKGTMGTVTGVNGYGDLEVKWDNGSSLSVIYGVDTAYRV